MPSGRTLVPDCALGRPNGHWLSRLPAKAKSWKFRQRLCAYLQNCTEAQAMRDFYAENPVRTEFSGFFDSFEDARDTGLVKRKAI